MILTAVVYFRNLALLGAWDLVTTFRANGSKMVYLTLLWSHTHSIFINNPFCYLVYFRNFTLFGGLEPSDHFQGNWAKNGLPGIILGPHIEFSQTTPHFVQNVVLHTKLLVSFRNVALLGAWNLVVTTFDTIQRIRPANLCKKK